MKNNGSQINRRLTTGGTPTIAPVNQANAPLADYLSAGVYWHHLGVFNVAAGTFTVQLGDPINPSWPMPFSWSGRKPQPRPRISLLAALRSTPKGGFPCSTPSTVQTLRLSPSAFTPRQTADADHAASNH